MASNFGLRALAKATKKSKWPVSARSAQTRRSLATAATTEQYEPEPYLQDAVSTQHGPTPVPPQRTIRDAKPFSDFLTDAHHRQHDYLRISVTERCNLRCLYCMPEEGIQLSPNKELLTTAEIYYLSALFVNQGVNKIRLTGGEPTVRKDIVPLMQRIGDLRRNGLKELALTTNGISLHRKLDQMVEAGLTGVNISLDTLDPFQFQLLTRRRGFDTVVKSIDRIQEMNKLGAGIKLKINCVVMRRLNDHQILPFVEKTRDEDVEVRFIEYMPFGGNKWSQNKMLPYSEMLDIIRQKYPTVERMRDARNDTSKTWQVPGFRGRVGFITSMTHNFCGTCNRLRITSDGNLKVCLHGNTEVSLRDLLRTERNGEPMDEQAFDAIRQLELDRRKQDGLRFDGEEGWMSKERQLLDVIGAAVKRKKAKHAGIGELEKMKNRPMILIARVRGRKWLPPSSESWSGIPTHLLAAHPTRATSGQSRLYSSNSRDRDEGGEAAQGRDQQTATSPFGFQSLTGLFNQEPERARYSSTRRSTGREEPQRAPERSEAQAPAKEADNGFFHSAQEPFVFRPIHHQKSSGDNGVQPMTRAPEAAPPQSLRTPMFADSVDAGRHSLTTPDATRGLRILKERGHPRSGGFDNVQSVHQQRREGERVLNPSNAGGDTDRRSFKVDSRRSDGKAAWGLSEEEDLWSDADADSPPQTKKPAGASSSPAKPTPAATHTPAQELTHVQSTGEAHMVDVGAKAATRRVAIAFGHVRFSNAEPFRLIYENNNQKGDVLSVARIAGIMASKRTADLIPLCHPLHISKVELDLKLEAPGTHNRMWGGNRWGLVAIQAHVECTGPTGVEMEALTAVTVAALTVVDMCKAVDRYTNIGFSTVVYKSGGKSGMYFRRAWAYYQGKKFFDDHGLEIPDLEHLKNN